MNHYIDIRILPDPEFNPGFLMSAMFSKLHKALHDLSEGQVGVTFPEAKMTPGNLLRLQGPQTSLTGLMATNWLKGMRDHIMVGDINIIPDQVAWGCVFRYQPANAPHRLRRRSVRKGWLSEQEALKCIPDKPMEEPKLPYLMLKSNHNSNHYRLYIQQSAKESANTGGRFNTFGMSANKTVAFF